MMRSSEKGQRYYHGIGEGSVTNTVHRRCECGELFPVVVVVAVDAQQDPDLAARATSTRADDSLNRGTCSSCLEESRTEVPMTYHSADLELLTLVLPEAYRHRELEERAALLMALSEQETPVPAYAVNFSVAYGAQGLTELLRKGARQEKEESDAVEQRLREVAAREFGLVGREDDLERLTAELDSRSSELTERELAMQDRKGALDRRTAELEHKTGALEQAREQFRAESEDGLPEVLRKDSTQPLDVEDILTSAPDPSDGPVQIPTRASVSGSSVGNKPAAPDVDSPTPAPILLDRKKTPRPVPMDRAPTTDVATDQHMELKDTDPNLGSRSTLTPPTSSTEVSESDTPAPALDKELLDWCAARGEVLKIVRGRDVRLIASVPDHSLEELGASDIRALLQLHKMPGYPLVTLTLARAATLAGKPGTPYSFHFDVGVAEDREVLDQLARDFRFKLEIFTSEYKPHRQRRLAAPLAANMRYVIALAVDTLRDIPKEERSFERAVNAFANPRHDHLGRSHPLARDFRDSILDKLDTAAQVRDAIALCDRYSGSQGEEYLVAIRSYPFERWHQRRLQVIQRAIELGLWMGSGLAQVAVSEGLVRSPRELVARCQNQFASFISTGAEGLSGQEVDRNWAALEAQAQSLGIMAEADTATDLSTADSSELQEALVGQLQQPGKRLEAIDELSRRKLTRAIEPISRALAELSVDEAAQAFAFFSRMGGAATPALRVFLDCPTPHLRHAAALALCELRDDEGIDSISDGLMSEEGAIWREYAFALGQVGASAIMPVVARVSGKGKREQARAVWALGYIAGQGGRKSVETLAGGRDATVAQVAQAALELEGRLRTGTIATEREQARSEFSELFYNSLSGLELGPSTAEISGQAMQLDESDLLEASDP